MSNETTDNVPCEGCARPAVGLDENGLGACAECAEALEQLAASEGTASSGPDRGAAR